MSTISRAAAEMEMDQKASTDPRLLVSIWKEIMHSEINWAEYYFKRGDMKNAWRAIEMAFQMWNKLEPVKG